MPAIYHEGSWLGNATDPEVLVKDTVGWTGKNLLNHTQPTKTEAGVSWTYGSNGEVIANGTTGSAVSSFNEPVNLKAGKYIVSGCPANGSISTYCIRIAIGNASASALAWEYGSGVEITLSEDSIVYIQSQIRANQTANNLTFYPMLRRDDIIDPTYEPYHESVEVMYEEEIHGVNLFNVNALRDMPSNVGFTKTNTGIRISNTVAGTWRYASFWIAVSKNKDYLVSCNVLITSGRGKIVVKDFETQTFILDANVEDGEAFTRKFNTGNYNSLFLTMYCATETAELGDVTYNNLMLRKADIEDSTYRPYNEQAIQNQLNAHGELGAKNLLNHKRSGSTTIQGITYTVNADLSISTSGTADANNNSWWNLLPNGITLPAGKYIISDNENLNTPSHRLSIRLTDNTYVALGTSSETEVTLTAANQIVEFSIGIAKGQASNNYVFKPMIRLASDPDDTYQPYTMTNRELTEKVFEKRVLTSSDDLNNITETGIYHITTSPANAPDSMTYCTLLVSRRDNTDIQQVIYRAADNIGLMYIRAKGGNPSTWKSWYKFTGTVVS